MKIKIRTIVKANFNTVISNFNEQLFVKLSPPFPKVKLNRFDGSKTGDIVELELNFILFKQKWRSRIIESTEEDLKFQFVDVGEQLPFFFKYWKHTAARRSPPRPLGRALQHPRA